MTFSTLTRCFCFCVIATGIGSSVLQAADSLLHKPSYDECMEQNVPVITRHDIYRKGWIDLNKNGKKDIYEDPGQPTEKRVADLVSQMTLDEKTAQLATLYGYKRVLPDALPMQSWTTRLWKDGIGNIDEHLNGLRNNEWVFPASKHAWAINEIQRFFIEDTRLGIPADFTNEAVGGLNYLKSTNFPYPLALGCTWDRDLVRQVGEVMGKEAAAIGYTNIYAPLLDVIRDPRWGRCPEDFGESPYLVSELGIGMVRGIRKAGVASTLKHFAIHSNNKGAREGEARLDPQCSPSEAEAIHLWPFARVIREAQPEGIMSSYNDYSGDVVQSSRHFLHDILRERMGFNGYIVSDSNAVEWQHTTRRTARDQKDAVRQSILAGLNVRTNFTMPDKYVLPLRELVREGTVPMEVIDQRVADVLKVKFNLGLFDRPYKDISQADRAVRSPENLELARKAARESIVLLKNDNNTLPLDINALKTIAVCGPNADTPALAVNRYGTIDSKGVVTLRKAIEEKAAAHNVKVLYTKGCNHRDERWPETEIMREAPTDKEQKMIDEAVEQARQADIAIIAVGDLIASTVGEGASRTGLDLPGRQDDLIRAVAATGKPVVIIHNSGRANSINWANKLSPAIIQAFFPGAYGDTAIAEVIFGDINPGGKLTTTFPKSVGQLPFNFPSISASQLELKGASVSGTLWKFGHGLSYTTFQFSNMKMDWNGRSEGKAPSVTDTITVSCTVTNTGQRAGDEVVQLYTHRLLSPVVTYDQNLRGFERIHLAPGEGRTVTFKLTPELLALVDANQQWINPPGPVEIQLGNASAFIPNSKNKKQNRADRTGIDIPTGSSTADQELTGQPTCGIQLRQTLVLE